VKADHRVSDGAERPAEGASAGGVSGKFCQNVGVEKQTSKAF